MTLEAKLDTLIEINQAMLTHFQSLGAVSGAANASGDDAGEKATRTRRTKKQIEEDAAAAAAAEAAAASTTKVEDAVVKNEPVAAATTTQAAATTAPSATAQADTASASQTPAEWKEVIAAFTKLLAVPEHGREAVVKVLKHFDEKAEKVPALEALGKNAEIIAHIEALLAPAAAAEEDPMAALGL